MRIHRALFAVVVATPSAAFAQALDCTNREPVVCQAVNDIVNNVNVEANAVVLAQSSSRSAFKPTNLYNALLAIHNRGVAAGCATFGGAGGIYDVSAGVESWSGEFDFQGSPFPFDMLGTCEVNPNLWSGAIDDGGGPLPVGDVLGVHNASGQIAANVAGVQNWMMGNWHRRVGNRGVYMGLIGVCPGGVDAGDVFDPWYVGGLGDGFIAPPPPPEIVPLPLEILDNVTICTEITLPAGPVADVSVTVDAEHTFVGDLIMTLSSPDGSTEVTLMDRPGRVDSGFGSGSDLVATGLLNFVDGAAVAAEDMGGPDPVCAAGSTCDFAPHTPLSAFNGLEGGGDWLFCVSDNAGGDIGAVFDVVISSTIVP